jgi:hypothetical protein
VNEGMSGHARERGAEEDIQIGEMDPRRRATLLESQADELRQRLDALLDEIARHHRRGPADLFRRYAIPVAFTALVAGAAVFAFTSWRRRRQVVWIRLGGRAQTQLNRLLT